MSLIIKDRVKETAAAPGTGVVTLGGAAVGFQTFLAAIGNANTVYYTITDGGAKWETGLGTYASAGNTLTRTTVLSGSNGTSAENFTSAVTIWGDIPALMFSVPTRQVIIASGTYTTPPGARQLRGRMIGGGGGGGGCSASNDAGIGGAGGNTVFNSINAAGGGGGQPGATGGNALGGRGGRGGSGGTSPTTIRYCGNAGTCGTSGFNSVSGQAGGNGAGSVFGGASTQNAGSPDPNTGAGGPGAATGNTTYSGGGGGSGEYVEFIINNPAPTYAATIGPAGTAGTAGSGSVGYAGATGLIIIDEIYY